MDQETQLTATLAWNALRKDLTYCNANNILESCWQTLFLLLILILFQ